MLATEESILEKGLFSVYLELNALFSENLNNPDDWRKMAYKKTSGLFRNDSIYTYRELLTQSSEQNTCAIAKSWIDFLGIVMFVNAPCSSPHNRTIDSYFVQAFHFFTVDILTVSR